MKELNFDVMCHAGEVYDKALKEAKDPHREVAAFLFDVPSAAVTQNQRRVAKTVNLGRSYSNPAVKLK